ncbi:MAG: SBBP repeat-containing protein [candidate division WOR-3 bacterium]|nr:SBBP repeat-containing protein [candidate division WOR-3 bacterium]
MTRAVLTAACLFLLGASAAPARDTLWTRRYQGTLDGYARALLVDRQDNVIVVGTCLGAATGNDVVVVKYGPGGDLQWSATFAGPGASGDEARAAALDSLGDIYVTASTGVFPDVNILTIKLTPSGTESWRRAWAGRSNRADVPAGIVVDSAGNAYVTGYTTAANGLTGWVTMKYESDSGLPLWTVVRPGEGGGRDAPTAIALGPGGTPYVTGCSPRVNKEDYVTVKYSTDGVEQWASFYDYSGNATDQAVAIAVDAAGDAYVTGRSATAPPPDGLNQYATVKYAGDSGAQMWVARYTGTGGHNSARAIALGDSAVYVTGSSQRAEGDDDYATVAYDKTGGSQLWATRFNGPAGKNDDPVGIAVLPHGMILVAGTSINKNDKGDFTTLRYTAAGKKAWAARYASPFGDVTARTIAYDGHCNPIVLGTGFGGAYYGFVVVKYDSSAFGGLGDLGPALPRRSGTCLSPNPAGNWTNITQSLSGAVPAIVSLLGVDGRMTRLVVEQ